MILAVSTLVDWCIHLRSSHWAEEKGALMSELRYTG